MDAATALQLADWRRRIAELYAMVRAAGGGEDAWQGWRDARQALYRAHPQSPVRVAVRATYEFRCFPHDPSLRALAELVPHRGRHVDGDDEVPGMTQVGTLRFTVKGAALELGAWWLDGYAGGLFVPFADATSGSTTYGGGRYVLDTAKGADLGTEDGLVVLDLNYAYAPSCAHDPRWRCPLAPPSNRLEIPVPAGETGP